MKGETTVFTLHVDDILPNRFQPRIHFDEVKINELAESIKKYGVIQPITVRKIGDKFEIIAGERRYKATVLAGITEIPAIINNLDDKVSSEIALIENVQREDLTPIEEAISYKKILDMGYLTQEKLAQKLGVNQSTVANKLRLLQLPEVIQEALLENRISERHARSLLKIPNTKKQIEVLNRIIEERLTVRKTDEEIKKIIEEIELQEKESEQNSNVSFEDTSEIEVLDILETLNEEKKEEEKMNPNDPVNQFDIPDVSIIDDKDSLSPVMPESVVAPVIDPSKPITFPNVEYKIEEEKPVKIEEVKPSQQNYDPAVNPGFMDIDKIEREATDIMKQDNPLQHPDFMKIDNPTPIYEDVEKMPHPSGKFFDVLPSMQNRGLESEVQQVSGNPILNTPSIFGNDASIFTDVNSISIPSSQPIKMEQNTAPIGNSILENPIIDPVVPYQPAESNVATPFVSDSIVPMEIKPQVVENNPIETTPISFPLPPIAQEFPPHQEVNPIVSPTFESEVPVTMEPQASVPIPDVQPIIQPSAFAPIPDAQPIMQPSSFAPIPDVQPIIQPSAFAPIPDVQPISESYYESKPEIISEIKSNPNVNIATEPKTESLRNTVPLSFNLREGIRMTRTLVTQLEALGLQVDMDEMDMPNLYTLTIHIEK